MTYYIDTGWGITITVTASDADLLWGVRPDRYQAAMDAVLLDIACALADAREAPEACPPQWDLPRRLPCLDNIETI